MGQILAEGWTKPRLLDRAASIAWYTGPAQDVFVFNQTRSKAEEVRSTSLVRNSIWQLCVRSPCGLVLPKPARGFFSGGQEELHLISSGTTYELKTGQRAQPQRRGQADLGSVEELGRRAERQHRHLPFWPHVCKGEEMTIQIKRLLFASVGDASQIVWAVL